MASALTLLYVPCPDAPTARAIGLSLLDDGLIACANIGAPMLSLYPWDGQIEEAQEVPLWLKTTAGLVETAMAHIAALHPYDCPCILTFAADRAAPDYEAWVHGIVRGPSGQAVL